MGLRSLLGGGRPARPPQILPPRRAPGRVLALTAAGDKVVPRRDANTFLRLRQPWQARAFAYYDLLGEIKYAAQFYSRGLSGIRLFVGVLNERGELEEPENENEIPEEVRAQLDRIQDPGGGRSGLLGSYGRLMFLVGEALLFVTTDPESDLESWEMLSSDELRVTDGGYMRAASPGVNEEFKDADDDERWQAIGRDRKAIAYRLWRRHPRYSQLPDATMQGVLELCEELLLLTQAVRARARSRLAGQGILFVPTELNPAPPVDGDQADEDPAEDPFLVELTAAITEPIADEGAASAVVPLVIRCDGEMIEKVRHLMLVDPTQLYPETGLRRECIDRIALGLDMPAEVLTGMADVNHWGSWMIDEQAWKGHLAPIAQALCDDLTAAYFRPTLRDNNVEDWSRYAIGYDAADVINHPDQSKNAKDLRALGVINERALRGANGFTEEDAMDDEERARWVGVTLKDASLALTGELSEPATSEPPQGGGGLELPPASPGPQQSEVEPGPPAGAEVASLNGHSAALHRIVGASDLALLRCREVAGNKLRNYVRRDRDLERSLEGVAARQVPAAVGAERARELGAPPAATLCAGTGPMIVDALRVFGVGADVAGQVAARVEEHAARTLYEERPVPLPPQFEAYVVGLLRAAV